MDIYQQFLNPLEDAETQSLPNETSDADLDQAKTQFSSLMKKIPAPEMDDDQRQKLKGKRFPQMQDLMFQCAAGLRTCQQAKIDLGLPQQFTPELLETSAQQDMSIGGVIKGVEVISRGADTGILLCAHDADQALTTTQTKLAAKLKDPSLAPGQVKALGFAFAEPLRALKQAQAQAQPAPDPEAKAHQQSMAGLSAQANLQELVAAFIQAAQSQTPPPGLSPPATGTGDTTSGKTGKTKKTGKTTKTKKTGKTTKTKSGGTGIVAIPATGAGSAPASSTRRSSSTQKTTKK